MCPLELVGNSHSVYRAVFSMSHSVPKPPERYARGSYEVVRVIGHRVLWRWTLGKQPVRQFLEEPLVLQGLDTGEATYPAEAGGWGHTVE